MLFKMTFRTQHLTMIFFVFSSWTIKELEMKMRKNVWSASYGSMKWICRKNWRERRRRSETEEAGRREIRWTVVTKMFGVIYEYDVIWRGARSLQKLEEEQQRLTYDNNVITHLDTFTTHSTKFACRIYFENSTLYWDVTCQWKQEEGEDEDKRTPGDDPCHQTTSIAVSTHWNLSRSNGISLHDLVTRFTLRSFIQIR